MFSKVVQEPKWSKYPQERQYKVEGGRRDPIRLWIRRVLELAMMLHPLNCKITDLEDLKFVDVASLNLYFQNPIQMDIRWNE